MKDFLLKVFTPTINLKIGKFSFPIPYVEAIAIVVLIFLLIVSIAQLRRHNINWSLKGILFGTFFGFILALTIEAFLIIKGGTILTGVLGWKNAPAPISIALEAGRAQLVKVLGVGVQNSTNIIKDNPNIGNTIQLLQNLNPNDVKTVKAILCK